MKYCDLYGASSIAAAYCGFKKSPFWTGELWQHGWLTHGLKIPEQVFGAGITSKSTTCLVASKWLEEFLKGHGYRDAHAIGLPSVYLPELKVEREEDTLLVMPGHTVTGMKTKAVIPEEYIEHIKEISGHFRKVSVCVFGTDFDQHGIWRTSFEHAGYEVIRGVDHKFYALGEQKKRFMRYSHMTTNILGSHVVYASAFGCRASISGGYVAPKEEDYRGIGFYLDYPEALGSAVELFSETKMSERYPWLFCAPQEAITNKEWGESEVGTENKKSPDVLRELMGWTLKKVRCSSADNHTKIQRVLNLGLRKLCR